MILVTIEDYELLVEIEPAVISAGEEAIITVKKQFIDGRVEEFPSGQIFDAEIVAGTEYGVLYDPNSGETGNSLQDVMNGFRIITSNSIAEDSVAIILKVRTTVGGELPTGAIMNSREETERAKQESEISKQKINTELLVIGGGEIEGYGKVVVKKDECDEEIVVCENSNPQTFNPTWIEIYRHNSYFDYNLEDPLNPNYIVQGCQLKRNSAVQGVTFIIPGMPLGKSWNQIYEWQSHTSAILNLCLETNSNRWIIKFDELRIPIFSSACIQGYIDLSDGLNSDLLGFNITNMNDYYEVLDDLQY